MRQPPMLAQRRVSIAGGDSWVGIPVYFYEFFEHKSVSIAGGDSWVGIPLRNGALERWNDVSIAGGDSWVGIRCRGPASRVDHLWFQSQVAILGWGY